MARSNTHVTLSGVEVIKTTEKAVLIIYTEKDEEFEHWLPRSVCMDGSELAEGDKDIVVEKWIADREGLPT